MSDFAKVDDQNPDQPEDYSEPEVEGALWDELRSWLLRHGVNPDQTVPTDRGTHLYLSTDDLLDAALEAERVAMHKEDVDKLRQRVKDQAETIDEQQYQLKDADKAISALEAALATAREETLEQAAQYHDRIAQQYEDNHSMMDTSDHRRFASGIRALRTAQPESEAEVKTP